MLLAYAGDYANVSGLRLPLGSAAALDILASSVAAWALLVVGAGLQLGGVLNHGKALLVSGAFKLLLMPALIGGLSWVVGVNELEMAILVLFAALPGAPSSYILARLC
ncbi:MAG: hypothetical protein R3F37_12230 [Candidatus Competibacteraceae bacterium]